MTAAGYTVRKIGLMIAATAWAMCFPVGAQSVKPARLAAMIQMDLQNELILGEQLRPSMASCLDSYAGGGWVLPRSAEAEISDRALQRKQRAKEACSAAMVPDMEHRLATEALRTGLEKHYQARMALEETKKKVRVCLKDAVGEERFKHCLEQDAPAAIEGAAWSRWLDLFARYTALR